MEAGIVRRREWARRAVSAGEGGFGLCRQEVDLEVGSFFVVEIVSAYKSCIFFLSPYPRVQFHSGCMCSLQKCGRKCSERDVRRKSVQRMDCAQSII